ncbi:MAG: TIGR03619 family F420-dependent LLM class oxidoreductase [Actinomycetes bacterium]
MVRIVPAGQVAVGMQLPIQSQSTLYAEPWEGKAGAKELAEVAKAADRLGFFYVGVCDHVAIPRSQADAMSTIWYDTMTTLGWLAGITENVRLLSHVAIPAYRHPLVTAKAVATLDALSNGRAIFGVGAGHVEAEFETYGVPFAERGAVLDETLDVIELSLREEYVTWHGERFDIDDMGLAPRPVQTPRPPIWVGGWKGPALRRVVERGDGWLPQGVGRDAMREKIAELTAMRDAAGKEPLEIGTLTEPLYVGEPDFDVGKRTMTGKGAQIGDSLREYAEMGCSHLQVRFRNRSLSELLDQMEAFATEAMPALG